jgi:hypothetical protein
MERTRSPQPHTILCPGYPFRLRCPFCPDTWSFWSIALTQNTALLFFGDIQLILKILLSHDKRSTIILFCSYTLYLDPINHFLIQIDLIDLLVLIVHHLLLPPH